MRIIGGAFRGRQILTGNKLSLRPTTDFAKEGLFNILSNRFELEDFKILDLFAGTGSISYEFASRGCADIHSVEMDPKHVAFIRNTATNLGFKQIRVIRDDVFHFITICKVQYNLIFADPPYDMENIGQLPDLIFGKKLLHPDGIFVLEHPKHLDFSNNPHLLEHRNYGNVHFSFFK